MLGDYSARVFMVASLLSDIDRSLVVSHSTCFDRALSLLDQADRYRHIFIDADWAQRQGDEKLMQLVGHMRLSDHCTWLIGNVRPSRLPGNGEAVRILSTADSIGEISQLLRELLANRTHRIAARSEMRTSANAKSHQLPLTPRQRQVLDLLQQGFSSKRIAQQLRLNTGTVDNHVAGLLRALGVANRGHAIARAIELGILRAASLERALLPALDAAVPVCPKCAQPSIPDEGCNASSAEANL